jgi:hypothetical protein
MLPDISISGQARGIYATLPGIMVAFLMTANVLLGCAFGNGVDS